MQSITWNLFLALQVIKYFRLFQILKGTFQLNLRIKIKTLLIRQNQAISIKRKYQEQVEKKIIYIYISPRIHLIKVNYIQSQVRKNLATHDSSSNLHSWFGLHKKGWSEQVLLLRTKVSSLSLTDLSL